MLHCLPEQKHESMEDDQGCKRSLVATEVPSGWSWQSNRICLTVRTGFLIPHLPNDTFYIPTFDIVYAGSI